jgi:hypothetical protein
MKRKRAGETWKYSTGPWEQKKTSQANILISLCQLTPALIELVVKVSNHPLKAKMDSVNFNKHKKQWMTEV